MIYLSRDYDKAMNIAKLLVKNMIEDAVYKTYMDTDNCNISYAKCDIVQTLTLAANAILNGNHDDTLDDYIENAIKHVANDIEKDDTKQLIPCHICKKDHNKNDLKSGAIDLDGYEARYFLLCDECVIEFGYRVRRLNHTCVLCSKRCWLMAADSGVCRDCQALPNIPTEIKKVEVQNKRASKLNLPATLTIKQWIDILEQFKYRCAYCNGEYECFEHYFPLSSGGGTTQHNSLPACSSCNVKKRNKKPIAFTKLFPPANIEKINQWLASQKG